MEKEYQYKRLLMFALQAAVLLLQTAIYAYIWYQYYAYSTEALAEPFYRRGNYVVIGLYALMSFFFTKTYGGYNVRQNRLLEMLYTQVLSVLSVNAVTYLQLCLIGHWRFLSFIRPIVLLTMLDLIVVIVWSLATRWMYLRLYPPRKILVVYGAHSPDNLIQKMLSRKDKYAIEETISAERDIDEIKEKMTNYSNVILTDISSKTRNQLLKFCFSQGIRCYCVPKISDIMIMSGQSIHLFDTSLLLFKNIGLSIEQRFVKRVFDVVMSLVFIVLSSPIMLLIAILIKAYDRGPVFFCQDRLTKDGEVFKVYKFRSMRVEQKNAEYCLTRKHDERITPVGRVIRNIHFDELPQLFNILKGDMSFVGPRPECPDLAAQYKKIVPEFDFRLKVKAGLTGFAQVYGKYNTTPYDKLKLDLMYIENYSFWLDIKLIMLTVKILFQKENTEGIEAWQTTAATQEDMQNMDQQDLEL